MDIKAGAADGA